MIEKLTSEEIEFMEDFYNPLCMAECLFSDYDNLAVMEDDRLAHVRLGQLQLLSYEYLLDNNPELSEKQNFQLRKGAGELYVLGGRLFGKTLFVEKVDLLLSMLLLERESVGFSSYDALHIKGVLEDVVRVLEYHPLYRLYKERINRNPYLIQLKNGWNLIGVNMNLTGKKPGAQFFQKHFTRLYIEEASFETDQIFKQRRDSKSENGCIFRVSGMTNFTKYSPCGKIFYDLSKRPWLVNLPQYVNPKWDENEKEKAIKDFGGEQSIGYRIFIKGEVVTEGVSVFDMERVRQSYFEKRKCKVFEITKQTFFQFETLLIIERYSNAEQCYLFADIGESAPTEIGVVFEINKKYRYVYNITLYNLTDKQQFKIFKWLAEKLKANFIALDCTDGTGRAIFRSLEEVFPKENLIWVGFNEKLPVDFERDDKNNLIIKSGKPVYREERVDEWSIKRLQHLFYGDFMEMPIDYKFDVQMNSVIAIHSGVRVTYECIAQENHLFQAFQVFAIAQWYCEFKLIKPINRKKFFKSGV